jgi:hypothetical protein
MMGSCLACLDPIPTQPLEPIYVIDRLRGQNGIDTYASIGLLTDEFELKDSVRWQVHSRTPHGIIC